jgi:hypothetical protein
VAPVPARVESRAAFTLKHFEERDSCPFFLGRDGSSLAYCDTEEPDEGAPVASIDIIDVSTGKVIESLPVGELPADPGDREIRENLAKANGLLSKKGFDPTEYRESDLTKATVFEGPRVTTRTQGQVFVGTTANLPISSKRCCTWNSLHGAVFPGAGFIFGRLGNECRTSESRKDPCYCKRTSHAEDTCPESDEAWVFLRVEKK